MNNYCSYLIEQNLRTNKLICLPKRIFKETGVYQYHNFAEIVENIHLPTLVTQ